MYVLSISSFILTSSATRNCSVPSEMKLIATVAVALAALALAAPNPEGQTPSIKLSKDYVDAIVAALSKAKAEGMALKQLQSTNALWNLMTARSLLLYDTDFTLSCRITRSTTFVNDTKAKQNIFGRMQIPFKAATSTLSYLVTISSFSKRRLRKPALTRIRFKLLSERSITDANPSTGHCSALPADTPCPSLRREDPRRETAPGKRGDLRLPQMNAEENGQETMLRPPLSPSSPVQLPALAGSPFPSCRWCFHLILRCCNHDEIAAEEEIIGLCQSEQIPPNLHEGQPTLIQSSNVKPKYPPSLQSRLSTTMATKPDANAGDPISTENQVLSAGASVDFAPLSNVCAHLNAFHAYASDPTRVVEANHYCGHLNEDLRQCILYDSPAKNARIIGIEYMITPKLYETLDSGERKLWHSHVYEGKLPDLAWQAAEDKEMEQVVQLYGKVFHLWQVDKGHQLPLGEPQLMTSFTQTGQLDFAKYVGDRDKRFNSDYKQKEEARKHIASPSVHPDADQAWKEKDKNKGVDATTITSGLLHARCHRLTLSVIDYCSWREAAEGRRTLQVIGFTVAEGSARRD
ncbi:hypothetical protein CCUS01_01909 [Colletotrichum cuscutae]|uniref:DUF1264-domain-containing protein n=1 Tax=Colletotrichum cuscutae TaxID=1209917 RepID=A0AAI9U6Y4_9PEZI|nr:hypothetical protein CCUS01_01909 [Colletotrichum cuscutae]